MADELAGVLVVKHQRVAHRAPCTFRQFPRPFRDDDLLAKKAKRPRQWICRGLSLLAASYAPGAGTTVVVGAVSGVPWLPLAGAGVAVALELAGAWLAGAWLAGDWLAGAGVAAGVLAGAALAGAGVDPAGSGVPWLPVAGSGVPWLPVAAGAGVPWLPLAAGAGAVAAGAVAAGAAAAPPLAGGL